MPLDWVAMEVEDNKKLTEENKKLTEENKELEVECQQLQMYNDELTEEFEKLEEEFERYRFNHYLAPECKFCNIPLTEDDLFTSLDVGEFCCEACEEKAREKEKQDSDKRIQSLRDELDEKNKYIAEILKKKNQNEKELKDEIKMLRAVMDGESKDAGKLEFELMEVKQELESLKKSNKQKTKLIHRFKEQVKELQKITEEEDD